MKSYAAIRAAAREICEANGYKFNDEATRDACPTCLQAWFDCACIGSVQLLTVEPPYVQFFTKAARCGIRPEAKA